MALRNTTLPQFYYHDHFVEMVNFVSSIYEGFLNDDEQNFIHDFNRLDVWAQCLYVRMCNRKKRVFFVNDLMYDEIGDIWAALEQLSAEDFIRDADERDYRVQLDELNKPALLALAREYGLNSIKASWSKSVLSDHVFEHLNYKEFSLSRVSSGRFIPQRRMALNFLLYLYFGKLDDNLTRFALRDLGVLQTKSQDSYKARFETAEEARAGFFYKNALRDISSGSDTDAIWAGLARWPTAESEFAVDLRNSLLHKIGKSYEKQKSLGHAKAAYAQSSTFESQERLVRILYAQGDITQVKALLDVMLLSPDHDEASLFAVDFYHRKFGQNRVGTYTKLLREAQSIEIDELYRGDVELGAIQSFARDGWDCHHTENGLWTPLFTLLFWEELFETSGSFSSAFDTLPKSLKDRTFHLQFTDIIREKLAAIREGRGLALVKAAIVRHEGEANGLFYWYSGLDRVLETLFGSASASALADLLGLLVEDFYGLRDGFPDLMLAKNGQLQFLEIKAEGDRIRRNQLARLKLLNSLGFAAGICKVTYRSDPDQIYVVVDVETTGGRPPNDRVTEIGAVKIQRGKIIEEWSSLINPEKRIPSFITQLTGISNAMVADAPKFADIAGSFEAFMRGAIFVAHNVNFDYGFIASEYRRLERRFRYPKLCTCSSMRKFFPGLSSYGLANLCRQYGIELKGHHRALVDARAAAELLGLINQRRWPLD